MIDDPMFMAELAAAKREEQDAAWNLTLAAQSYDKDLQRRIAWHFEWHGGEFEDCPAPTCSGEVPA